MYIDSGGPTPPKLSVCIATFNRGLFIAETLESILCQITNECEVVVLNGGSTDNTEQVVRRFSQSGNGIRYFSQGANNGIDRDYDRVVELARGEFCWLMTDDDLLKPGAIDAVLRVLREDVSLVVVNAEAKDSTLSKVVRPRWLQLEADQVYAVREMDRLFTDTGDILRFIGAFIIKRDVWMARDKERYYGTLFIHIGVIFQNLLPGAAVVLARPMITYRMGNVHTFSDRKFEIFVVKWSSLVWSLEVSAASKSRICKKEPWRSASTLLWWRALGSYSINEYRNLVRPRLENVREIALAALISVLPGGLVHTFCLMYLIAAPRYRRVGHIDIRLEMMRQSPFSVQNWLAQCRRAIFHSLPI